MEKTAHKRGPELNRRQLLATGGAMLAGLGSLGCQGGRGPAGGMGEQPNLPEPNEALFLTQAELDTLVALTEVFIPEDLDPGAPTAECARAINLLLSAFSFDPPRIFAGGPFSKRGGSAVNHFEDFLPLDAYEEAAWRLKIEGSQNLADREFNGTAQGWQSLYREGLAALDAAAAQYGFDRFASMPLATRELLLRAGGNETIARLVDVAFMHTLDAMYGAPEYGGNQDLLGWGFTGFMGDVQPRGYTREEVENPDNPGLLDLLPLKRLQPKRDDPPQAALLPLPSVAQAAAIQEAVAALMVLHSEEISLGLLMNAQGSWSRLQNMVSSLSRREDGPQ